MKKLKRLLALVMAMAMVVAMALPAWADGATVQDADKGSITVKSPIMGAQYTGYRIFDLTISESGDSIAYTIDTDSPFFAAVDSYAKSTTTEHDGKQVPHLTLTEITTAKKDGDANYKKYSITVSDDFDAQHFGQAMQKAINGTPASEGQEAVDPITVPATYKVTPDYTDKSETTGNRVTLEDTDQITFKNLALGYYLITSKYPEAPNPTAKLVIPAHKDGETDVAEKTYTFDKSGKDTTDKTTTYQMAAEEYANAVVTDEFVEKYIEDNGLKENKEAMGGTWTNADVEDVKQQLLDSYKASAIAQTEAVINNKLDGAESDLNVKEPVLVFVDSTTKTAEINEKNEQDKWDVPVNPEGSANVEGLPEHGEPHGGKNIIVGYADEEKTKPIYADWTEANIGDTVNYELRVNAMNFVREDGKELDPNFDGTVDNNSEFKVQQVKEYIIGDYQNDSLKFDPKKDKIMVKIVNDKGKTIELTDGQGNKVKQEWDYTAWSDKFFLDESKITYKEDKTTGEVLVDENGNKVIDQVLGNGGGIAIPWAIKTTDKEEAEKHKIVTSYQLVNNAEEVAGGADPTYTTYYWYSIYDSDVTIVVNYSMTLTDKATIDMPGNVNTSQYGLNYTDKDKNEYEPPKPDEPEDREKPDKSGDTDTATVYTYALAIQKVDENGEKLPGAVFKIQGLTATELKEGYYKVNKYVGDKDTEGNDTADSIELKADKDGLLVIEGFSSSAELTVKEAVAPDGYNLLSKPVKMQATKVGAEVKTVATTTEWKYKVDKDGNEIPGTRETTKQDSVETRTKKYLDKEGNVVAYEETVNGVTKYYVMNGENAEEDTSANHMNFDNAVSRLSVTLAQDEKAGSEVKVDSNKLAPKAINVVNHKGKELPSTGGIGTTIFYVVGAILVIGAGVVLITKRRMDA